MIYIIIATIETRPCSNQSVTTGTIVYATVIENLLTPSYQSDLWPALWNPLKNFFIWNNLPTGDVWMLILASKHNNANSNAMKYYSH